MKVTKKKKIILALVGVIIIAALTASFVVIQKDRHMTSTQNDADINSGPATQQDINRDNSNKQRIVNQQNNQSTSTGSTGSSSDVQTVTPVITYAGNYGKDVQIAGYVDVFEQGGTCTATFTLGPTTITRSVAAVENASTVNCPEISIDTSSFTQKGNYSVTLSYSSAAYSGTSDSKQVEVQ